MAEPGANVPLWTWNCKDGTVWDCRNRVVGGWSSLSLGPNKLLKLLFQCNKKNALIRTKINTCKWFLTSWTHNFQTDCFFLWSVSSCWPAFWARSISVQRTCNHRDGLEKKQHFWINNQCLNQSFLTNRTAILKWQWQSTAIKDTKYIKQQ